MNRMNLSRSDPSALALPSPRGEGGAKRRMRWITPELLFYIGFIPLIWVLLWKTTAFPQFDKAELLVMGLFSACVALKMLLFDRWKLSEVIFFLVCLAIAGMSWYKSRFNRPLLLVIAIFGARGLDGKKIIKVWLLASVLNLILAVSGSLIGIIENYRYEWARDDAVAEMKNSLGMIHTTDCAARVFFTCLAWFYVRGEKLKWFEYLLAVGIAGLNFYFTGGRIDSGCILIMDGMFLITNILRKTEEKSRRPTGSVDSKPTVFPTSASRVHDVWQRNLAILAMLAFPGGTALSLGLCFIYSPSGFFVKFNKWTSNRLFLGNEIFKDYDITLFGQPIVMYGNGGGGFKSAVEDVKYNFMDISYQQALMLYGIVFFVLLLGLLIYLAYRQRMNTDLMICLIIVAFNCMIAHHLTELAYVPYLLLVFAQYDSAPPVEKHRAEKLNQ